MRQGGPSTSSLMERYGQRDPANAERQESAPGECSCSLAGLERELTFEDVQDENQHRPTERGTGHIQGRVPKADAHRVLNQLSTVVIQVLDRHDASCMGQQFSGCVVALSHGWGQFNGCAVALSHGWVQQFSGCTVALYHDWGRVVPCGTWFSTGQNIGRNQKIWPRVHCGVRAV